MGIVLPLLISADVVAVTAFRRHAVWSHLWRLFPWTAFGIVIGSLALNRINDQQVEKLIGAIVLGMVVVHHVRRVRAGRQSEAEVEVERPASPWFIAITGILAGFTTMVANAAGPIMILYFLAMRLPKMEFIGTGAWYYLVINLFKVPFSYELGLINPASAQVVLRLAPFAVGGALFGRAVLRHIPQKLFEDLALLFSAVAGLRLLLY